MAIWFSFCVMSVCLVWVVWKCVSYVWLLTGCHHVTGQETDRQTDKTDRRSSTSSFCQTKVEEGRGWKRTREALHHPDLWALWLHVPASCWKRELESGGVWRPKHAVLKWWTPSTLSSNNRDTRSSRAAGKMMTPFYKQAITDSFTRRH